MRNHQSRSTKSESFLEVNAISFQTCGQGREWGCGHEKNPPYHGSYSNNSSNSHKRKVHCTTRSGINIKAKQENGKCMQDKPPKSHDNNCYRCGMKRHWSCTCRTPKHLVDLYQVSIKAKGKYIKMNFTNGNRLNLTYYDIDFFRGPSEKNWSFNKWWEY